MRLLVGVADPLVFPGPAVVARLLAVGHSVRVLAPALPPRSSSAFTGVDVRPLLPDVSRLAADLAGVDALVSVRWPLAAVSRLDADRALHRGRLLVEAVNLARLPRVVWVSSTGADRASGVASLRAAAHLEAALAATRVDRAVLRVAGFFGRGDRFLPALAWLLRAWPFWTVPWAGRPYWYRPVHVDEFSDAVVHAVASPRSYTRDVAGPDRLPFVDLLGSLGAAVGRRPRLVRVRPALSARLSRLALRASGRPRVGRGELAALAAGRLDSAAAPVGRVSLLAWLAANADLLRR